VTTADALVPLRRFQPEPVWSGRSRQELEAEVEEHLEAYVRVGLALAELQGRRMYEPDHDDFTAYVRARFGWTYVHAFRVIQAAEVALTLPIGNVPRPANEWQARALVPLKDDAEVLEAAWCEVLETTPDGGQVTAAMVRKVVKRYLPAPVPGDAESSASDHSLRGFYRPDDVVYRQLYTSVLKRLSFLSREAAKLEKRFRRRARQAIDEDTLAAFARRLGVAVDELDRARRTRLLPPPEEVADDAR
jgi:hypothetical protein